MGHIADCQISPLEMGRLVVTQELLLGTGVEDADIIAPAGQLHRVSLGVEAENASSDITATDDKDVNAEVDLTVVALTLDADGRVTSAIGDMAEPALTIAADGGVTAPDTVRSKLELGDSYGMRGASSLDKEWYEHSEGWCDYLKGKTRTEIAGIPDDGSDADLAALCTISVTELQKAALAAFAEE